MAEALEATESKGALGSNGGFGFYSMKKLFVILFLFVAAFSFSQQKFALVIGNGAYTNVTRLNNPVNDANDMEAALKGLGFTVEKVLNGNLSQMESGIVNLKKRLKGAKDSYGFFFYAGHGVQSNGENYLIPVDANIQSESFLRRQSISVQEMLDELNDAGNELNVVVLDACRDNPFPWKRSSSRGLQVVGNQPADSIIVYATSAGSTAADGTDRNGLFTSQLLKNLRTPGLEVSEVFRLTGADVTKASERKQIPAIYNQFFGRAYLGAIPAPQTAAVQPAAPAPVQPQQPTTQPPAQTAQPAAAPPPAAYTNIPSESAVVYAGNGHKYEVIDVSKTWSQARKDCEKRGGYLVTITSKEEQEFIRDLLSKNGKKNSDYWLGGYREGKNWQWVTGEDFTYKNWAPGEPNNDNGQNKLMFSSSGRGKWDDNRDSTMSGYICEWD